jgi:hypothetical protein
MMMKRGKMEHKFVDVWCYKEENMKSKFRKQYAFVKVLSNKEKEKYCSERKILF